ncbi:hypothetical protein DWU98_11000 [Dyella monticola]|uniref:Autotransporter domain-containing protein n=1 Tax=Dyella monticola TaxID=1927958 RepID=A0A370X0E5_9GAMM|nr:autotransporter-associated beta strand repeat-containing protein [Dyella monticola]RDS81737.1 hypothetical protein DWU98_11000 [Dyella monticola]
MNRIYRLVWNRSLAVVQVACELTSTHGSSSGTSARRTPRRRPLALAIASLALACASAPALSQTCTPTDPSGCGAPGGSGQHPGRNNDGGSGNGTGGDATFLGSSGTSETAGSTADASGDGGNGADGVYQASGATAPGGTGGLAGAIGSTGLDSSVNGNPGNPGTASPSNSFFGGGGGGGGAGVFVNDSSSPIVANSTTINGGAGGVGGDATTATNADPGAGGGGGAGVIIGAGAGSVTLTNNGTLTGGAGGAGGNGGYAGSGGGGGDGLLVLGAGTKVTNAGTITGGAGGNPGTATDGQGEVGGFGGGGTGVNLVGAGETLINTNSISGGNANPSPLGGNQNGTPGIGVQAWGGDSVTTSGSIAGGSNGAGGNGYAVLFSGGGNTLTIEAGASFIGSVLSTSGTTNGGDTLALAGDSNGTINPGLFSGFATYQKTGNSTWTLNGADTTGINWTIEQGQLTGDALAFGGNLTFANNNLGTAPSVDFDETDLLGIYSHVISGAGEVIKDGNGTLALSGANTYTGGTVLDAGVLGISADANLGGSGGAVIINGGTLQTSAAFTTARNFIINTGSSQLETDADLTISGNISGSGTLNKFGLGTLTLSGANSYTGGTSIFAGTLQGTTSSLQGNIDDEAALAFNQTANGTYTGNISGAGSLSVAGTGIVTLAGTNTYAGGTTISGGTLEGNTASLQGTITDNAALAFNQATNGTYSGVIAGTGMLTKEGTGTVTLTGANTYTGGTTISAGTLQGNTTSLQGNMIDNAALVFDQTANGTYNGVISGAGTLTANGTGALTLDGANTITGLTNVTVGSTLIVGDSSHTTATVGGDVSVNGGTLSGFGTVQGSVTLSNNAALTPGEAGAIGSLTIGGDLTIGDGTQLNFDFGAPGTNFSTPGQSDHVVVQGNLSIGSTTLNVNNLGSMGPGLYNLFQWGTALDITGGGFAPPSGMSLQILTVDRQINLIDTLGVTLDEWDANGLASPSQMGGGSGTWSISSNTWSNTNGQYVGPMSPQPGFAIFGGAAGTVAVDDSNGNVSALGMQFVSNGYHLTGDAIDLVEQSGVAPVLRVSSGDTAIIDNVLQGTDGFNKTDGGTLVLTGTNTYTGTTTLSGGYLSVSSDTNLGASSNPLDFEGGTLEITGTAFNQTARTIVWGSPGGGFDIDDANNAFTVSQTLTGSGGLLKSGAGTLVLSGANTYSGGTVIDAGTLQGDTSSLQGNITDNATLLFAQTSAGSFSGAISGSGQVIKNGGGTLTLSGANNYTGGTTISAGTLQGDTNSLQGNIANNAALVFNQVTNGTYSGVISGSGNVTKTGSGTLLFTGANVYSGVTTISAGMLQGSSTSLQGTIVNNATLEFAQTSNGSFSGAISGGGQLIKSGSGTLTLIGTNTYTGGTTVNSGTLQGDASSLQGTIANNAAVIFNQASDATFSNVISGSGSLTKTGAGTLILDGVNTYTGGTAVSAGTLEIGDSHSSNASIDGTVDVQSAGTLRGHGTVDGNVTNDGIVWPGGSMGTLTIAGNYTQNADGALQIDVTPTQSSMLKVTGNASLAGTLDLIFAPGTYNTGKYTLLQAGSVSGTFSTVNGTVPGTIQSQLSYSATAVDLTLANESVMPLDSSLFGNLMRSVDLASQQDLGSVLDVALMSRDTSCGAGRAPSMQNVASACGGGAWAQYTGSNISLGGSDGSNSTSFGLLGGADYAVGDAVHVGLQAGVGQVNGNDKLGGNGRVDDVHGGIYAYANAGPIVLSAVLDAMHSDYHFNRTTGVGTATSTPGGNMQSAAFQAAWPLQLTQWQLTPKVGALYQRQTLDGFSETLNSTTFTASNFPVDGTRSRYTALQPYAVMAIEHSFVAHGITYVPEVSLGYRYDTHDAATPIVQVTAQDGTTFDLPGSAQGRGLGTASARITAQAGASWSVYADYQGFFGSRVHDNALSFGFTKHF